MSQGGRKGGVVKNTKKWNVFFKWLLITFGIYSRTLTASTRMALRPRSIPRPSLTMAFLRGRRLSTNRILRKKRPQQVTRFNASFIWLYIFNMFLVCPIWLPILSFFTLMNQDWVHYLTWHGFDTIFI